MCYIVIHLWFDKASDQDYLQVAFTDGNNYGTHALFRLFVQHVNRVYCAWSMIE